jgi:hypothetical protein
MTNARYSVSIDRLLTGETGDIFLADPIDYREFVSGMVYVPITSSVTTLTWYAAFKVDGEYFPVDDASGAALVQTVAAGQAHPIPSALSGASFLKISSDIPDVVVSVTMKN